VNERHGGPHQPFLKEKQRDHRFETAILTTADPKKKQSSARQEDEEKDPLRDRDSFSEKGNYEL